MHEFDSIVFGPSPSKGLLISVSGVDGSGKTTTIRNTANWLRVVGFKVKVFKLPSTEVKKTNVFKNYKLNPLTAIRDNRVDSFSMGLVVLGDRLNTILTEICPLLEKGYIVIVDRYVYSVIAELCISSDVLNTYSSIINGILCRFPKPNISVFNRVSLIESVNRIKSRPLERDSHIDHELVRKRIDMFEIIRCSFNGTVIDTALDQHSCLNIMISAVNKELKKCIILN